MTLSPLDITILTLFIGSILALGFSAKLRENTLLQYLAAGRNLSLPAFVATLVSTWYGGILGIGESVSYFGVGTWLLLGVPYYVFALAYAFFFAKRVRSADQITIPERLELRWGKWAAIVGAGLLFMLAVPAAHVLMLGVLVASLSGLELLPAVILATFIGTIFLYRGGLLADVRVSLLAFTMMYIGFAVIVGYCLLTYPPAETFSAIEPSSLLSFTGGTGWITIISFFILGSWTLVDPGFHQRVASTKDPQTGRRGVIVSVLFWVIFDLLSITTGLYAVSLLRPMPDNPLAIFPAIAEQILPPGLKAVFLCGMLGTIVSALVGYALIGGASLGKDIISRMREGLDEKVWTRIGIGIACFTAVVLALQIPSVVNLWYQWGGCTIGALLIPVSVSYLRETAVAPPKWVVASMILAFALSFLWLFYGYRTNNTYLNVALIQGSLALPTDAEVNSGALGSATVVGIGTLLPALVISAATIGLGRLFGARHEQNG